MRWLTLIIICATSPASVANGTTNVTVALRNVEYGVFATRYDPNSISRYTPYGFDAITDCIPLETGTIFGVQMHVHASEGGRLKLAAMLRRGGGPSDPSQVAAAQHRDNPEPAVIEGNDDLIVWTFRAKNNGRVRASYALDRRGRERDMIGIWTMDIALLSIDGRLVEHGGEVLQPMVIYSRTFTIHPKTEECRAP